MRIFRNGRDCPFMYEKESLTTEKVQEAVNAMTYGGLQTATTVLLFSMGKQGLSPAETMQMLEKGATEDESNNIFGNA